MHELSSSPFLDTDVSVSAGQVKARCVFTWKAFLSLPCRWWLGYVPAVTQEP